MHVSLRAARIAAACATPLAVVAAGALVWQGSYAAFTGQTRNSGNDWSTGTVALTDDDHGSARFQVSNMAPGDTDTKCITVTANATVPGVVRAYAVNPTLSSSTLADHIFLTVQDGTGGSFASCDGFTALETEVSNIPLSSFVQSNDFASGQNGWNVSGTGSESRTFRITWAFDTTGMTQTEVDDLQGKHVGFDVQWELQSN